jgi:hypothetical protein
MPEAPELYVPARERRGRANWPLVFLRLWCVIGCIVAWFVFIDGTGPLHFRAAIFTLAGFYVVWQVGAWILRPARGDEDR